MYIYIYIHIYYFVRNPPPLRCEWDIWAVLLFYISNFPKVSQWLTRRIVLQGPNCRRSSTTTGLGSAAAGANEDSPT